MTVLLVPYHLDERLPDSEFPVTADRVVSKELHGETFWSRVAGLYDLVGDAVATAPHPVVVTGDCTVALGVVSGLQRQGIEPSIMWFDAHGDLHTPESSASAYPGGMVLRMLIGDGDPTVAETTGLTPVPPHRITLVDARDLDGPERVYLADSPVSRIPVEAATSTPEGPIYLHLDLDVIDADSLPGLRYPFSPGPSFEQLREAALGVLATGRVAAMTIACTWEPGSEGPRYARHLIDELLTAAAESDSRAASSAL
jgi:arginase